MTKSEARDLIIKEYQFLSSEKLKVIKQFVLSDGRVTNTFLVTSSKKGFEKFIAKSFVVRPESIEKEWKVLNLLQGKVDISPKLLIPDHSPDKFILMEYIEGISAFEAINNNEDLDKLFTKIGETSGKFNSVEVDYFGDILNPSTISWEDYLNERIKKGVPVVKKFLTVDEFKKVMKMIDELRYILKEESKKPPVLVHHDFYLDNYIIKKDGNIILIDYGIVFAGRPIFDLAKFYIWTLIKYPDQKEVFLDSYFRYVEKSEDFDDILKLYTIKELFGMIDFFTLIKDEKMKKVSVKTLKEFISEKGKLNSLIFQTL